MALTKLKLTMYGTDEYENSFSTEQALLDFMMWNFRRRAEASDPTYNTSTKTWSCGVSVFQRIDE